LGLAIGDAVVRATGGEWHVGEASLGGALMEVRWHRSSGAKNAFDPRVQTEPPVTTRTPSDAPVVG
jgi:hypothetical protein